MTNQDPIRQQIDTMASISMSKLISAWNTVWSSPLFGLLNIVFQNETLNNFFSKKK